MPDESDWRDDAICTQIPGDLWFPDQGESVVAAKGICNTRCEVRDQCLEAALADDNDHFGVRGGRTVRQRRALRKARAAA